MAQFKAYLDHLYQIITSIIIYLSDQEPSRPRNKNTVDLWLKLLAFMLNTDFVILLSLVNQFCGLVLMNNLLHYHAIQATLFSYLAILSYKMM